MEKTGLLEKIEYLFNEAKHLEIYMPTLNRWHRVTPNDFRSFDGKRRIQGEEYEGPLYAYCLLYTSPSPRDRQKSRMPSSA